MGGFGWWSLAAALLLAAGVGVPYGLLGGGGPSLAVPAFWSGFGIAVIALVVAGVARWRV